MSGPVVNKQLASAYRNGAKSVLVDSNATQGAQIGVNLWDANGTLITQAQWASLLALSSSSSSSSNVSLSDFTTDDLNEGEFNLYFTNARAQAAVGSILQNTATIDLTYTSGASPLISANLTEPGNTGTGTLDVVTIDVYGRVIGYRAATTDDLPQGQSNLYQPIITAKAAVNLTYPQVVALDGAGNAYIPDLTVANDLMRIVGVTLNAATTGNTVKIARSYAFTEAGWSWTPGRIYCAQSGGTLTQTPPTTGAILEVARVITPTSIFVDVQVEAIIL